MKTPPWAKVLVLSLAAVYFVARASLCTVCLRPWAIWPAPRPVIGGYSWYCRRCRRDRVRRERRA